jgi:opacity protein-like surface antigen
VGLAVIVLVSSFFLRAQETPKVEVFGGYSLARFDDSQGVTGKQIINNGWTGAVSFNFSKNLGAVADFAGYYGTHRTPSFTALTCPGCPITFPGIPASTHIHTFMFGPQVSARLNSVTPFAHALFGAAHYHGELGTPPLSASDSAFALALGGGLDTRLSKLIAWRVQGDYLRTSLLQTHENNLRLATGVVFRFGH